MYKVIILVLSFVVFGLIISCEETTAPPQDAILMSKEDLSKTIGYTWFNGYWNYYETNDSLTNLINTTFDSTKHKFIIFIEPECTCKELVKEPAYLIKILDDSKIPSKFYEIYAMGSLDAKQPYEPEIRISKLPCAVLVTSDTKYYSVIDSFEYWVNRSNKKLENIILEALEK